MNRNLTSVSIVTTLVLFLLVSGLGAASANHEVGHYEFELDENYYDFLLLSFEDDAGVESGGRTAVDNETVRTVYVVRPDKRIGLFLTYEICLKLYINYKLQDIL